MYIFLVFISSAAVSPSLPLSVCLSLSLCLSLPLKLFKTFTINSLFLFTLLVVVFFSASFGSPLDLSVWMQSSYQQEQRRGGGVYW